MKHVGGKIHASQHGFLHRRLDPQGARLHLFQDAFPEVGAGDFASFLPYRLGKAGIGKHASPDAAFFPSALGKIGSLQFEVEDFRFQPAGRCKMRATQVTTGEHAAVEDGTGKVGVSGGAVDEADREKAASRKG